VIIQVLVNGIILGSLYAVVALGFSLVWGVMDVINLVHGTMIVMGAYVAFLLFETIRLDPFLSMPVAAFVLFFFGFYLQKYLVNFVVRAGVFISLILTFGMDQVMVNLLLLIFTGDYRSVTTSYSGTNFEVGGVVIPYVRLAIFFISILLTVALYLYTTRTKIGNAIRATALNREAARICGVNVPKIYGITMGISAALAGACGCMYATLQTFTPFDGGYLIGKAFVICVLGGLGTVMGAIVGGIALGVAETLGATLIDPRTQEIFGFIILVLVLIFRPKGILGTK
jgi:branched-chain amino acid transport system permease protein